MLNLANEPMLKYETNVWLETVNSINIHIHKNTLVYVRYRPGNIHTIRNTCGLKRTCPQWSYTLPNDQVFITYYQTYWLLKLYIQPSLSSPQGIRAAPGATNLCPMQSQRPSRINLLFHHHSIRYF